MTANREAIISLFEVSDNRAAAIEPKPAIFPSNDAPVVRCAGDGTRELVELSWGFVLTMKDHAPKRVTNVRDDKLDSRFWASSFRERRCLGPVTSFAEPKGRSPAIWHWFALGETRKPFAFAGLWRSYKGPVRRDGNPVELDVFAFLTTKPNDLVATVHPSRMPVMLVGAGTLLRRIPPSRWHSFRQASTAVIWDKDTFVADVSIGHSVHLFAH